MEQHDLRQLAAASPAKSWIQSRPFDLAFFILSPLVALPVLYLSPEPSLLSLTFGCVLGVPHYLSTFTFFFWDESRARHRMQWLVFFGGPAAIAGVVTLLIGFGVPYILQVGLYVWNTLHVARQSSGIQSIYRHRAGVTDPAARTAANQAILSTAFALAFWNTSGYPLLHTFLSRIWTGLPNAIWVAFTVWAAISLVRLGISLWTRRRNGRPAGGPELAFLATSLLLFHPYLWIRDANQATLGMLLGHFIQYLAIVWLVHRRREVAAEAARSSPGWLRGLSANAPVLVGTLAAIGIIALGFRLAPMPPIQTLYATALLSLALIHFYLDGVFWAFKRPDVRATLGPFVMGRRAVAPVVTGAA